MNAPRMLRHLTDSFQAMMGERAVVKWLALRTPIRWPPGVPTRPGGFEDERRLLLAAVERCVAPNRKPAPEHPIFGAAQRVGG